jgi:hypothetical protein
MVFAHINERVALFDVDGFIVGFNGDLWHRPSSIESGEISIYFDPPSCKREISLYIQMYRA